MTPTCCLSETTPIDRLYFHVSGAGAQARVWSRVFSQANEVNPNVLVQTSFTGLLQYICREVIDYRVYVNPQPCFKVSKLIF